MSYVDLRAQVKDVVDTVANIQEVSLTPKLKFSGYPAAYVVPRGNDAEYETTSENVRTYSFSVIFLYETKVKGVAGALSALEAAVDAALDAFDQEDLKAAATRKLGINLDSNKTYLNVWATPGEWGELPDEQLLLAELIVRVRLSVDIT